MGKLLDLTKRLGRSAARGLIPVSAVKQGLAIDQHKALWTQVGRDSRGLWAYLRRLHSGRDPHAPGAPDLKDFSQVLEHWGLTEEQLPRVLREMRWTLAAWWAVWAIFLGLMVWSGPSSRGLLAVYLVILSLVCVTGIVTTYYRYVVLTSRRFMFFKDFILGRWDQDEE